MTSTFPPSPLHAYKHTCIPTCAHDYYSQAITTPSYVWHNADNPNTPLPSHLSDWFPTYSEPVRERDWVSVQKCPSHFSPFVDPSSYLTFTFPCLILSNFPFTSINSTFLHHQNKRIHAHLKNFPILANLNWTSCHPYSQQLLHESFPNLISTSTLSPLLN